MIRPMRFFAAMGDQAFFAAEIAAGIVLTVKGSPWLLVASLGLFTFLFIRIGCADS